MKICYVLNSGDPGGVEQHVLDLTRGMVARGHNVYVVCPWGEMVEKYFDAGAEVHIDSPKIDIDPFYIFRLIRFLKKTKPDVFHVHMLKTVGNGLVASKIFELASFLTRGEALRSSSRTEAGQGPAATSVVALPPEKAEKDPQLQRKERALKGATSRCGSAVATVAHIHTPLPEWQIPWWKKKIDIIFNRIVTNWAADVVMALTESRKRVKIEGEGIDPKKIVVIPNGVETEFGSRNSEIGKEYRRKLGIDTEAVLVGTLSRLTVEKGVCYLIEALPRIADSDLRFALLIGGSGELKDDLEKRAGSLTSEVSANLTSEVKEPMLLPRIEFLGFVPEAEKWDYLSALDIFVFPSLAEGFGISLIEAMAAGCACLASDLEVLQEVGGDAVEFFETKNPEDLAQKLSGLIEDNERREELSLRAQERVEKEYSLEKFLNRYEELYEELLN